MSDLIREYILVAYFIGCIVSSFIYVINMNSFL